MRRALKTIGIFLSAILLLASCSSDDDEVSPTASCYCEGEIIKTIHGRGGQMLYNKELGRWYIQNRYHQAIEYVEEFYCPDNLDEKFKKVGLEVLFSGDLYEIKFDGEVKTVEESKYLELSRYCIDLISIENYPKMK